MSAGAAGEGKMGTGVFGAFCFHGNGNTLETRLQTLGEGRPKHLDQELISYFRLDLIKDIKVHIKHISSYH